jgi:xylulokinase
MILAPKDYLRWLLAGELHTDPSDGSGTLLFDARQRAWSGKLLKLLDIQEDQLPPVLPSDRIAGQLTRRAAKDLGLASGIPVVTGAADTACGMLGAGVIDDLTLLLTISTGGQLILPAAEVNVDKKGRIHTFCSAYAPDSGQPAWYQMAATLSAGLSLRWLRDRVFSLGGNDAYRLMTSWAEAVPAGANGLIFLPYLVGERTPHMDPLARGLFLGLTASHGRAELVRAVMEGVTLACYDAYSILAEIGARPGRIVMAGGGARSSLWQRIVADVFGLPVQSLETTEQAAAGAVLLAGSGLGLFDLRTQADQWTEYGLPIEPDHFNQAHYRELFDVFRAAYPKHRADFERLNTL